jgi:precorrin-6B methylase 1
MCFSSWTKGTRRKTSSACEKKFATAISKTNLTERSRHPTLCGIERLCLTSQQCGYGTRRERGLIGEELGEDECGAFLVWGDPSLYDSTLRIIDQIIARGTVAFECEVIPGISAIQALAARHRITLNRIGRSIHITTGRKIAEGLPNNLDRRHGSRYVREFREEKAMCATLALLGT